MAPNKLFMVAVNCVAKQEFPVKVKSVVSNFRIQMLKPGHQWFGVMPVPIRVSTKNRPVFPLYESPFTKVLEQKWCYNARLNLTRGCLSPVNGGV